MSARSRLADKIEIVGAHGRIYVNFLDSNGNTFARAELDLDGAEEVEDAIRSRRKLMSDGKFTVYDVVLH